jgi:hypothetical protein
MAEIRKFNPEQGNAIAQALRAAMGDPVRPAEPGARTQPAAAEAPAEPVPPAVVTLSVKTVVVTAEDEED